MDLFEYILILVSVVYALALAQILSGVARLAQVDATYRWFPPHILWTILIFHGIFIAWWAGWEFHDIEWTYAKFLFLGIKPVAFFYAASLIIPRASDGQLVDFEKYFLSIRRPFLIALFIGMLAQFADGPILANEELWAPYRVGQAAVALCILGGVFIENRRALTVMPLVIMAYVVNTILTRFWLPG